MKGALLKKKFICCDWRFFSASLLHFDYLSREKPRRDKGWHSGYAFSKFQSIQTQNETLTLWDLAYTVQESGFRTTPKGILLEELEHRYIGHSCTNVPATTTTTKSVFDLTSQTKATDVSSDRLFECVGRLIDESMRPSEFMWSLNGCMETYALLNEHIIYYSWYITSPRIEEWRAYCNKRYNKPVPVSSRYQKSRQIDGTLCQCHVSDTRNTLSHGTTVRNVPGYISINPAKVEQNKV